MSVADRRFSLLAWRGPAGLHFETHGPGDGALRYRLTMRNSYFDDFGPTAVGLKEAEAMRSAAETTSRIAYKTGYLNAMAETIPTLVRGRGKMAEMFAQAVVEMVKIFADGKHGMGGMDMCESVLRVVVPALNWQAHPALAAETLLRGLSWLTKEDVVIFVSDVRKRLKKEAPPEVWAEDILDA